MVLVTGVSRFLGSSLAGRLSQVGQLRVIGVDSVRPDAPARARLAHTEVLQLDLRHPQIADVIADENVDTVIHASASMAPVAQAARAMTKEMNVLGTMQLLSACQRSPLVRRVVVRSSAVIYGSSHHEPSVVDEETLPQSAPVTSAARQAADIEQSVRSMQRRRPDISVAIPRFSEIIGPTVRTPLTRYFGLQPAVPVIAGFDPRLQFVHENDAVDVLENLTFSGFTGPVNIAGDGIVMLSQAIRRLRRPSLPVPGAALDALSSLLRLVRISGFSSAQLRMLGADRVMDTAVMRHHAGITLRYSTAEAFADFATTMPHLSSALQRKNV